MLAYAGSWLLKMFICKPLVLCPCNPLVCLRPRADSVRSRLSTLSLFLFLKMTVFTCWGEREGQRWVECGCQDGRNWTNCVQAMLGSASTGSSGTAVGLQNNKLMANRVTAAVWPNGEPARGKDTVRSLSAATRNWCRLRSR